MTHKIVFSITGDECSGWFQKLPVIYTSAAAGTQAGWAKPRSPELSSPLQIQRGGMFTLSKVQSFADRKHLAR